MTDVNVDDYNISKDSLECILNGVIISIVCLPVGAIMLILWFSIPPDLISPPPPPPFPISPELSKPHHSLLNNIIPILTDLGYNHLANEARRIHVTPDVALSFNNTWTPPITIFTLNNTAVMLQQHCVHGLYSFYHLKKLTTAKIETLNPLRCFSITTNGRKVFVGGIRISNPDLFNNGQIIIHGLEENSMSHSYVPLESCMVTSFDEVIFSPVYDYLRIWLYNDLRYSLIRVMSKLRTNYNNKYNVLISALQRLRYEFETLDNMTVFAVEDSMIYEGQEGCERDIRYHIVPNQRLLMYDIERLPVFSTLPTLDEGERLMVTNSSRINYMRIKSTNMYCDENIVVHGIIMPFPRLICSKASIATSNAIAVHGGEV